MSTSMNNIFNFNRNFPEPFDKLTNKKVSVSSKYGSGTNATLNCTMIKAVHAVCRCMNGTGEGAVGVIDHRCVAEYKSSVGSDAYHLVVYDSGSGQAVASIYDKSTEVTENYVMNASQRDGAAVIMAVMPMLLADDEFKDNLETYYNQFQTGFSDMTVATESMAVLCDNAYRRIKDDSCPAHVKLEVEKSGNLMRVSQTQIDSGTFTPTTVTAGEFIIFAKTGPATIKKAGVLIECEDFKGKYELQSRLFNSEEQGLIPQLPEWYIIPQEVVDICKHAKETTGKSMQMRNFLLRGPAGTGKTMGAKAVAAGLNLPYMKYTCSAGTEIFDFIGMIFPDSDSGSTGDATLDQECQRLKSMGGINYTNVAKLMTLPDLDDMDYDPVGVYQKLTGKEKEDATSQDCMGVVLEKVTEKVKALSKRAEGSQSSGQTYSYVETDFIKALKNGYVIEIQERATRWLVKS